jgi:hypothetical protein
MIDISKGVLKIDDTLSFYPGFRFEDFKETKYYNGQDGIRVIYLDEKQIIDGKQYIVNFFFRNNRIYVVSLINCDEDISESDESNRKIVHDEILKQNQIESGYQYPWGKVLSEFDARSNISSINIYYD